MNEIRRFMRYTLPGLVFSFQLLLALSFSNWDKVEKLEPLNNKSAIGIALGVFLATGALGYILSIIYFGLYWFFGLRWLEIIPITIDHRPAFRDLYRFKIIDGKGEDLSLDKDLNPGTPMQRKRLSKRDAWIILTQYWYSRKKRADDIHDINDFTDR